jgi:glycosyltransferase involved in cell wall biosynthesis
MASSETVFPKSQGIFFVSSGRYVARKRMDRFVLAADALKRKGIRFVWYLLGDGEEKEKIKLMIEQYDLQENVIQIGAVSNPFVYYKEADCFVMASESEGQPMVLNEALILGTPIITTNFPSAQEVIGDKGYGLIVSNTDEGLISGVLNFAEDDQLRLKMTQAAKEFVYPNEKLLKQIDEVILA